MTWWLVLGREQSGTGRGRPLGGDVRRGPERVEELAQLGWEPWWQNPEPRPRGLAHVPGVARPACEVVAIIQQPARLGLVLLPLPFHARPGALRRPL